MTDYELMVAFDREDPAFARGVEIGMLWQRLQTESFPVRSVVHASNVEMALRLAEAIGVSVSTDDPTEDQSDWLALVFAGRS